MACHQVPGRHAGERIAGSGHDHHPRGHACQVRDDGPKLDIGGGPEPRPGSLVELGRLRDGVRLLAGSPLPVPGRCRPVEEASALDGIARRPERGEGGDRLRVPRLVGASSQDRLHIRGRLAIQSRARRHEHEPAQRLGVPRGVGLRHDGARGVGQQVHPGQAQMDTQCLHVLRQRREGVGGRIERLGRLPRPPHVQEHQGTLPVEPAQVLEVDRGAARAAGYADEQRASPDDAIRQTGAIERREVHHRASHDVTAGTLRPRA